MLKVLLSMFVVSFGMFAEAQERDVRIQFSADNFRSNFVGNPNPDDAPFERIEGTFRLEIDGQADQGTVRFANIEIGDKDYRQSEIGFQYNPSGLIIGAKVNGVNSNGRDDSGDFVFSYFPGPEIVAFSYYTPDTPDDFWIASDVEVSTDLPIECALGLTEIRNSVEVSADGPTMSADFSPQRARSGCTLQETADALGYSHFQWVQVINEFPSGLCLRDFGFLLPVFLPIADPPYGGFCKQPADYLPYYWDEGRDSDIPRKFWIESKTFENFLQFSDTPKSEILLPGQRMEFTTSLVGVISGSNWVPLYTWNWKSNYTQPGGGVFGSTARDLDLPEGGTGEIFEVSILPDPTGVPQEVEDLWQSLGGFETQPRTIDIDVKSKLKKGCERVRNRRSVRVTIFGHDDFDVLEIDQLSLRFANSDLKIKGNGAPRCRIRDVNHDGEHDLKCKFSKLSGEWIGEEFEAFLVGELFSGETIAGSETICVLESKNQRHR